ncbi:hypothetical protein PCE1_003837 [Barthelona sp. PCE]
MSFTESTEFGSSMYLNTLGDSAKKKPFCTLIRDNLTVQDIEGATPKKKFHSKRRDIERTVNVDDIKGAIPKKRILEFKRDPLRVDDIPGARPRPKSFKTKRCVNPLNPQYEVPLIKEPEPYVPKFLRDTMKIDDIDGTRAKPKRKIAIRDHMNYTDITSGPKRQFKERNPLWTLESKSEVKMSKRCVNPVDPIYPALSSEQNQIAKSKPKQVSRVKISEDFSLRTDDIDMGYSGAKRAREEWMNHDLEKRNPNTISDIDGASPAARKVFKYSNRKTDPVAPEYQDLGRSMRHVIIYKEGISMPGDWVYFNEEEEEPEVPEAPEEHEPEIEKVEKEVSRPSSGVPLKATSPKKEISIDELVDGTPKRFNKTSNPDLKAAIPSMSKKNRKKMGLTGKKPDYRPNNDESSQQQQPKLRKTTPSPREQMQMTANQKIMHERKSRAKQQNVNAVEKLPFY